jgi:hypothetical protein
LAVSVGTAWAKSPQMPEQATTSGQAILPTLRVTGPPRVQSAARPVIAAIWGQTARIRERAGAPIPVPCEA